MKTGRGSFAPAGARLKRGRQRPSFEQAGSDDTSRIGCDFGQVFHFLDFILDFKIMRSRRRLIQGISVQSRARRAG